MEFLKRVFFYMLFILLCISIYNDITKSTLSIQQSEPEQEANDMDAFITKIKVEPGDTVLSITEQINNFTNKNMNIQEILTDFKQYNPNVDPYHLQESEYYYFLNYNDVQ